MLAATCPTLVIAIHAVKFIATGIKIDDAFLGMLEMIIEAMR